MGLGHGLGHGPMGQMANESILILERERLNFYNSTLLRLRVILALES